MENIIKTEKGIKIQVRTIESHPTIKGELKGEWDTVNSLCDAIFTASAYLAYTRAYEVEIYVNGKLIETMSKAE